MTQSRLEYQEMPADERAQRYVAIGRLGWPWERGLHDRYTHTTAALVAMADESDLSQLAAEQAAERARYVVRYGSDALWWADYGQHAVEPRRG